MCIRYLFCFCILLLTGCVPHLDRQEKGLIYIPSDSERAALLEYPEQNVHVSPTSEWGQEILLGQAFAKEGDWYRALTSFKKARFLLHLTNSSTPEIEARITWSECLIYAFNDRWHDVTTTWEHTSEKLYITDPLMTEQWSILLFTAYTYEGWKERADSFLAQLPKESPIRKSLLEWRELSLFSREDQPKDSLIEQLLLSKMKSPQKAKVFNALLPGLGYWYTGQKESACTSFLLNGAFIGATIQLFQAHQPFLALITLSFEAGWYLGGITGAGIEAENYNQRIKEATLTPYLRQKRGFPLLETKIGW